MSGAFDYRLYQAVNFVNRIAWSQGKANA